MVPLFISQRNLSWEDVFALQKQMMKNLEQILKKSRVIFVLAVFCNFLWGSATPSIKVGYRLFEIPAGDTASQILFAGCRFILAGVLSIILGSLLNGHVLKPGKSAVPKIGVLALLQTVVQYIFFYIGLANTTGMKASIIIPSNVFISILVASVVVKQEKLTFQKILGCIVGFAGVILVNLAPGAGLDMQMSLVGEGAVLLSTTANALSSVTMKSFSVDDDPVMLSGYQFVLGGFLMLLLGGLFGGWISVWSFKGVLVLLYLALVSALAYSIYSLLMKYSPVSRVTIFGFMNPVFGVLLSSLLLQESGQGFGVRGFVALLLVCLGIFIVNHVKEKNLPCE